MKKTFARGLLYRLKPSLFSRAGEHPTFAEIVFLWGGHPARPVAVAGETPAPQEDVFA